MFTFFFHFKYIVYLSLGTEIFSLFNLDFSTWILKKNFLILFFFCRFKKSKVLRNPLKCILRCVITMPLHSIPVPHHWMVQRHYSSWWTMEAYKRITGMASRTSLLQRNLLFQGNLSSNDLFYFLFLCGRHCLERFSNFSIWYVGNVFKILIGLFEIDDIISFLVDEIPSNQYSMRRIFDPTP